MSKKKKTSCLRYSDRWKTVGRPFPLQVDKEIDIIFFVAFTSRCHNVLWVLQTSTLLPRVCFAGTRIVFSQLLQAFEVLNSPMMTAIRPFSLSCFFRVFHNFSVTPQRLPFSFIKSFPSIPFPKTISGVFLLFSIYDRDFHLFSLPKKKKRLVAYFVGTLMVAFRAAFLFFFVFLRLLLYLARPVTRISTIFSAALCWPSYKKGNATCTKKLTKKWLILQALPLAIVCNVVDKTFHCVAPCWTYSKKDIFDFVSGFIKDPSCFLFKKKR